MAKINITINTKDKTLTASVNGKSIDNVGGVNAYLEGDLFHASIMTHERLDDNTVRITRFVSTDSAEAAKAIYSGHAVYDDRLPDLVGIVDKSKVQKDIEQYFGV